MKRKNVHLYRCLLNLMFDGLRIKDRNSVKIIKIGSPL